MGAVRIVAASVGVALGHPGKIRKIRPIASRRTSATTDHIRQVDRSDSRRGGLAPARRGCPLGNGLDTASAAGTHSDRSAAATARCRGRCGPGRMDATGRRPRSRGSTGPTGSAAGAIPERLGTTRHMAILVKDGLAMRLTLSREPADSGGGWRGLGRLRRLPEAALHRPVEGRSPRAAGDDRAGGQGGQAGRVPRASLPMPLPKVAKPRTTNDPEARGDLAADPARRRSGSAWITPRSSA